MKHLFLAPLLLSCLLFAETPTEYVIEDGTQKATYVNKVRHGMTWWYNDKLKIKSQVNFSNGQEQGLYTSFYDNGAKKLEVGYVAGQKDGIQKMYYDNGQLGSKVLYKLGRREGLMLEWDIDGFKTSEVLYKRNYKVGMKKYFNHTGKVVRTQNFKMDRNPVMQKLLKDKRDEILVDLAKYGLVSKDAPKEERMR